MGTAPYFSMILRGIFWKSMPTFDGKQPEKNFLWNTRDLSGRVFSLKKGNPLKIKRIERE
jgi:hypothetical protein